MNKNKELIKLFISFMFAFAIMFVVLLNQRVSNISNNEVIQVSATTISDESEIEYTQTKQELKAIPIKQEIIIEETIEHEPFEEFEATAYCPCPKCCGKWADGITASGTKAVAKRTIAVDASIIPLGAEVEVEGLGTYIAEDTGSAIKGKIIDFYFDTHEEALKFGRQKVNLKIVSSINGGN